MLFEVLERLISENKINKALVQLRFYGPKEEWLIDEIKKYHLENVVNVYGHVSKEDILERQKESQLLLLLLWNNKNEEGFCPGKIYDYFGARRPIIAIGWPGSVVENLLEITNAGKFAWNAEMLTEIINDYYNEFIKTREVKCHSNSTINNYNYRSISKQYSQILYELIPK
jgi:glycosyltransferase involved in cell wall biosynthesis